MSDPKTYERRVAEQTRKEVEAFDADARAQYQAILDHWWQTRRDLAAEHRRLMRELNPTGLKIW